MTITDRRAVLAGLGATFAGTMGAPPASANRRAAATKRFAVSSPDGLTTVELLVSANRADHPCWMARHGDRVMLEPSQLALVLADGRRLGPGAQFRGCTSAALDESWHPPYGIANHYDGKLTQLDAQFEDRRSRIRFAIRLIAHNDGVACRFVLLSGPRSKIRLGGEWIEFRMPAGTRLWTSRDEGEYAVSSPGRLAPVPHPELTASTDKGPLADTPALAQTPSGLSMLLCESDRLHYPRMMFAPGGDDQTLVSRLMHFPGRATGYSGPGDTHAAPLFTVDAPFTTPWRVLMVADTPTALIGKAGLVPTLASPNRLVSDKWISPGRAFRIRKPYSNAAALEAIAFADARKLDYIEFDAHWYGDGTDPSDATRAIDGLDMPAIVAAARQKGMGTILYVDRVPAMRQLDTIVTTYREWGVAGIKFGFIWEGRQEDVDWIYNLVKTCGDNRLLVNLHDNLRPAGLERTLPNYVALEGVRGNEQFPTARHNVTLPFTRALSGPIDYTICYDHYKNRTTNAHQLAMAAVFYNPLTFLYWYDTPGKYETGSWPALRWFDECPTSWDETCPIGGEPGEYVAVARRNGARWFMGTMTNEEPRTISVALHFLGEGKWRGTIFADGVTAKEAHLTPVTISTREFTRQDSVSVSMQGSGGQAILFEPIS